MRICVLFFLSSKRCGSGKKKKNQLSPSLAVWILGESWKIKKMGIVCVYMTVSAQRHNQREDFICFVVNLCMYSYPLCNASTQLQ